MALHAINGSNVVRDVVDLLERCVEQAKRGEIRAIQIVCDKGSGHQTDRAGTWCTRDLVYVNELLKHEALKSALSDG